MAHVKRTQAGSLLASLLVLAVFTTIAGCPAAGNGGGTEAGVPTGGDPPGASTDSVITLTVSGDALPTGAVGATSTDFGPHLFWVESYHRFSSEVHTAPLVSGTNAFAVSRDRMVVAGVVDIPDPSAVGAHNLGSAISLIGTIHITSSDLDAIPVSETAQSEIDLGAVEINEENQKIESGKGANDVANEIGHAEGTLDSFGRFDQVFTKFANLDIDRSGVLDTDENLRWNMITETDIPMEGSIYSIESDSFLASPSAITPSEFEYMFIVQNLDEYAANDGLVTYPWLSTLSLPDNASGVTELTQTGSYTTGAGGVTVRYLRFPTSDPALIGISPLSGDFEAGIVETDQEGVSTEHFRFNLENLEFMSPGANFEGLMVPVVDYELDEAGIVQTVGWHWKKVSNGGFVDATAAEVRLQVMSFVLAFDNYPVGDNTLNFFQWREGEDGIWNVKSGNDVWYGYRLGDYRTSFEQIDTGFSYSDGGQFDVASYDYPFDPDVHSLVVLTEDSAGNFYGFLWSENAIVQ